MKVKELVAITVVAVGVCLCVGALVFSNIRSSEIASSTEVAKARVHEEADNEYWQNKEHWEHRIEVLRHRLEHHE